MMAKTTHCRISDEEQDVYIIRCVTYVYKLIQEGVTDLLTG